MPRKFRQSLRARVSLRLVLLGLVLPCVYLGGAGAAFFYRQHTANEARDRLRLPTAPAPTNATRLLVFAPHCDDETLGCGGLIQQTLDAGGSVRVVIITNGDGFRTAVERYSRKLRVAPGDFIQFASLRQQESYQALAALGVPHQDVLFLGYPDRGLLSLWNDDWTPAHLYASEFTRCTRSPYPNTFDPQVTYCGQNLLADVKTILKAFHPTLVTVTHPAEDHPDHAAAAAFVTRALEELQSDSQEAGWAQNTRLEYYLIHRGDWPLPQGAHPADSLLPPVEMSHVDTHWQSLPLTAVETRHKFQSIKLYPSQTALMGSFLESFARRSELFGEIASPRLPTVPEKAIHVDADPSDWEALPPALLDPVRDNVLRDLQGGGDIRALYACRDHETLYLRLDTRQPVSERMTYTLRLRAFGLHGQTSPACYTLQVRPGASEGFSPDGVRTAACGRILEAAVPWAEIARPLQDSPVQTLAVSAETSLAGVEIDQTGVRFLQL